MKKVFTMIGKVLLIMIAAIILFLLGVFVYNRIMLFKEEALLKDQKISQMVEVDGHKMSIYVSGEGAHTLVFMAGSGAPTPVIDYKEFTSRFEDENKIVIIEKFGYGFSDEFDGQRDVKTRVDQNRKALKAAGVNGPYILCAHSYSGLETVYWAQNFPDEIEAIIGLDMAVPRSYDKYDENIIESVKSAKGVNRLLKNMGIVRPFVGGTIPEEFSEEEKKIITAVVCKNYGNKTEANEADYIISDLAAIDGMQIPDIPTLLIISDGTVTDGWIDYEMDYAAKLTDVTTVMLNCGHSVYDYEPDKCEEAMDEFIGGLSK